MWKNPTYTQVDLANDAEFLLHNLEFFKPEEFRKIIPILVKIVNDDDNEEDVSEKDVAKVRAFAEANVKIIKQISDSIKRLHSILLPVCE